MINKDTYKRLTERRGGLVVDKCGNCPNVNNPQGCTDKKCYEIMKNRLAELEDKIENGTLVEFPRIVEYTKEYGGQIKQYSVEYVSKNGTITSMPYFELKAEAESKLKELHEAEE